VKIDTDTTDQISYQSPPNIFVATNWPERQAGTHGLLTDGTVEVMYFGVYDAGSPQQKHYVFYSAATTDYSIYLNGAATGAGLPTHIGGIYNGFCWRTTRPVAPTSETPCRIYVDEEWLDNGAGTVDSHRYGLYGIGRFTGEYTTDVPPKMIRSVAPVSCVAPSPSQSW
jgi:hypothetical protein